MSYKIMDGKFCIDRGYTDLESAKESALHMVRTGLEVENMTIVDEETGNAISTATINIDIEWKDD